MYLNDFNSIKVQLEHLRVSFVSAKLNFNSIKVQLEHLMVSPKWSECSFQFHKGTIRTQQLILYAGKFEHFNSIKVQLELLHYLQIGADF